MSFVASDQVRRADLQGSRRLHCILNVIKPKNERLMEVRVRERVLAPMRRREITLSARIARAIREGFVVAACVGLAPGCRERSAADRVPVPPDTSAAQADVPATPIKVVGAFAMLRPNAWRPFYDQARDRATGMSRSFARVYAQRVVESIDIDRYDSGPILEVNEATAAAMALQIAQQHPRTFLALPSDRKLYERRTTFAGMAAYEAAYAHDIPTPQGSYTVYWKLVLIPAANGPGRGLAISYGANTLLPEIRGIEDVGVNGQLPILLNTFEVVRAEK